MTIRPLQNVSLPVLLYVNCFLYSYTSINDVFDICEELTAIPDRSNIVYNIVISFGHNHVNLEESSTVKHPV